MDLILFGVFSISLSIIKNEPSTLNRAFDLAAALPCPPFASKKPKATYLDGL